jgi:hypothetical protein
MWMYFIKSTLKFLEHTVCDEVRIHSKSLSAMNFQKKRIPEDQHTRITSRLGFSLSLNWTGQLRHPLLKQ